MNNSCIILLLERILYNISLHFQTLLWVSNPKLRFETYKSCPLRCTSVLSDDSELSTLCDEEPLGTGEVAYDRDEEEVRPELLSSSEDSSPEADLPFSKKFLNVFVNSTSRSSSKSHTKLFRHCTLLGNSQICTVLAIKNVIFKN